MLPVQSPKFKGSLKDMDEFKRRKMMKNRLQSVKALNKLCWLLNVEENVIKW